MAGRPPAAAAAVAGTVRMGGRWCARVRMVLAVCALGS